MALLLFSLRHVPDDEADDIRDLLVENQLNFYETNAGNWGISMPAIWLPDDQQYAKARSLIDKYQEQRRILLQKEYQQLKQSGEENTFFKNLWRNPVQTIVLIAAMILVIYVSIKMVFEFSL
jgi:hypothetical protein